MCQDIEHGGARCPTDTSTSRRYRRKVSTILASVPPRTVSVPADVITPIVPLSESMTKLKARAEELREKSNGPVPQNVPRDSWDAKNEQRITALGIALGKEADRIAGYDGETLKKEIENHSKELYANQRQTIKEVEQKISSYYDEWAKIEDKYGPSLKVIDVNGLKPAQKALLNDEEKELVKKMIAIEAQLYVEEKKLGSFSSEIEKYKTTVYAEAQKKLTAAYIEVLSQIRPLGGVDIKSDAENGDNEAQKVIADTVGKHYPTAWLEQHNASDPSNLRIKFTEERAQYKASTHSKTEDDGIVKNVLSGGILYFPTLSSAKKIKRLYDADEGSQSTIVQYKTFSGRSTYFLHVKANAEELYDENVHGSLLDVTPDGRRWYKKTSLAQLKSLSEQGYQSEKDVVEFLQQKVWVRLKTTTKKEVQELQIFSSNAGKIINQQEGTSTNRVASSAYHEFGHRMEEVLPNNILPRHEKAFLARRSGKTDSSKWYENMVACGGPDEFGHDADLVISYASRDYYNDKNYEVFTIGVESLYAGAYGGLMGNSKDPLKSDPDHRGFVLGTLATL